ncbi:MAG: DinB family protein [Fimbriimonadaceae bacterium]
MRDLLISSAELAFKDVMTSLEGVTENQAWAVLPQGGSDYLHTDGSIHSIVLHMALVKFMYASIAWRNTEIRWSQCAVEVESFEPSWDKALDYHQRAHDYWMSGWANCDLEAEISTNYNKPWVAWKLIQMMNHHDSYHAGQIAVLRYASPESELMPPSVAEDIRKYCSDSVAW